MCLRGFVVLFFGLVFLLPVASLPSLAPTSSNVPIACASILPAHVQNAPLEKPALGCAASAPRASVPFLTMAEKHVFTRAKIQDKNTALSLGGSGYVGIGTASPGANLSVYSATAQNALSVRANNNKNVFVDQYGDLNVDAGVLQIGYDTNVSSGAIGSYSGSDLYLTSDISSAGNNNILLMPHGTGKVGIVSTNPDFLNAPPRIDAG